MIHILVHIVLIVLVYLDAVNEMVVRRLLEVVRILLLVTTTLLHLVLAVLV